MKKVFFYNTVTRKKEEFIPIEKGKVGIYSCGPTVYSSPHIGNMYAYIMWDILVRSLRYFGYGVKHVMNLTDVGHLVSDADSGEDKMEKGARREGLSVWDVAKKYTDEFFKFSDALNIKRPDVVCKATDHIQEQIDLIKKIEERGFTYVINDGVYFDTSKFSGYADFAKLDLEKLREGARVETNEEKRNPADFALWKFSPSTSSGQKRQMEWESPWGVGFPGWHIECTAMSTKYLGQKFDIHTGGEDHIPVHHTNEIAQGFGAFGGQTANFWLHNAFMTSGGSKISKSAGGFLTIDQIVEMGIDPLAFRYLSLTSHYRKGLDFSIEALKSAENGLENLREKMGLLRYARNDGQNRNDGEIHNKNNDVIAKQKAVVISVEMGSYRDRFGGYLSDNLNTAQALALVWEIVKDGAIGDEDKFNILVDFDKVLGLDLEKDRSKVDVPSDVVEFARERQKYRMDKQWDRADELRRKIEEKGFRIEDKGDGFEFEKI